MTHTMKNVGCHEAWAYRNRTQALKPPNAKRIIDWLRPLESEDAYNRSDCYESGCGSMGVPAVLSW